MYFRRRILDIRKPKYLERRSIATVDYLLSSWHRNGYWLVRSFFLSGLVRFLKRSIWPNILDSFYLLVAKLPNSQLGADPKRC